MLKYKKVAFITGATRGLGKSLIDALIVDINCLVISLSRSLHESHKDLNTSNLILLKTDLSTNFNQKVFYDILDYLDSETLIYFFNNEIK